MNLIADMWRYAELCSHDKQDFGDGDDDPIDYISDTIAAQTPKSLFLQMKNGIEYCYVVDEPSRVVIVFRGTDGAKAWRNNFDILPLVDGYMHQGFYDLMQYFGPEIKKCMVAIYGKELKQTKPLFITGHSLGGIMSQYCAKYLYDKVGLISTCVNFGSPVGGTKKWAEEMNKVPVKNYRVVNGWDLVTEILDDTIGGHAGKLVRLPQPKIRKIFKLLQLLDHAYSRYTKALIKYSEKLDAGEAVYELKKVKNRCNI
mgnify:CR=1 FL=1